MKKGIGNLATIFLCFILVIGSIPGVIAPSHPYFAGSEDEFFGDGGTLPGDFGWFIDVRWDNWFGDSDKVIYERYSEAYRVLQKGDYENAELAVGAARDAAEKAGADIEAVSLDGVTLDNLASHEGVQKLYDTQLNALEYKEYSDALEAVVEEQIKSGTVDETTAESFIDNARAPVAEVTSDVEQQRYELSQEVSDAGGTSGFEADIAYETSFRNYAEGQGFENERFQEIARITDAAEAKAKIAELEIQVAVAQEAGNSEEAEAAEEILNLARSHLENCIKGIEYELSVTAENHLAETEVLAEKVDALLNGEINVERLIEEGLPTTPATIEELKTQVQERQTDANAFLENRYDALKEQYSNEPAQLAKIEQEASEARAAQALAGQLDGALTQWSGEGLADKEIADRIYSELTYIDGGNIVPPGLYVVSDSESSVGGEVQEVAKDRAIIIVTRFDPETGAPGQVVEGWYNGKPANVEVGGGVVQNYKYTDETGFSTYVYGPAGYSYTTSAGLTYPVPYAVPEGETSFAPTRTFNAGDEAYSYPTNDGGKVTYTSTGYYMTNAEGKTVVEEAYTGSDKYIYLGPSDTNGYGGTLDIEPTGVIVTNLDGEATSWEATPELTVTVEEDGIEDKVVIYYNPIDGKVFTADAAPHEDVNQREGTTSTYDYVTGGDTWTYDSSTKTWTSVASGATIKINGAPAPVGFEGESEVETPEGIWKYDSASNSWTSSTGAIVTPSPNMNYRYDSGKAGYYDARGEFHSASEGYAITDKYTGNEWAYNPSSGTWKTPQGESYDPKTGNVVKSDGTIASSGSGGNYWGYYQDSSGKGSSLQYSGYGGYQVFNPTTNSYTYVNPGDSYYGGFKPGESQKDSYGNSWVLGSNGAWTNQGGGIATSVGSVYSGGGAPVGTKVNYAGKEYFVDPALGWTTTNEQGQKIAVGPPPGQPSSNVGYYSGNQPAVQPQEGQVIPGQSGAQGYSRFEEGGWKYYSPGSQGYDVNAVTSAQASGSVYSYGYGAPSGSGGGAGYGGSYGSSYGCANGACGGGYYYGAPAGSGSYFSPEADAAARAAGYSDAASAAAAVGGSYGGYGAAGGYYGASGYGSGAAYGGAQGYYSPEADAAARAAGYADAATAAAAASGSYYGGGYGSNAYGSAAQYGGYGSGSYGGATQNPDGSWTSSDGTTYSGGYTGGEGGSYSGSGSYSGGYTGGEGGSYSGGSTGGSTGGESGSTGGSTGGESGSTGGVISETDKAPQTGALFFAKIKSFFSKMFKK
ncbi:MAG: hypothetical protein AABY02_03695 [Nanoarchaeota archaeon]